MINGIIIKDDRYKEDANNLIFNFSENSEASRFYHELFSDINPKAESHSLYDNVSNNKKYE